MTSRKADRKYISPKFRVCPECGAQSTKQRPDGTCPDEQACAKRRDRWVA